MPKKNTVSLWAPAAVALASMASPLAPAQFIYTAGHGDIGLAYEDGAFEPHWHLHSDAVVNGSPLGSDGEFEAHEVLAYVPNPSIARPAGSQWDFLGIAAGSPLWYLPQIEDSGKPFLGIASEELTGSEWSSLTISLVSVNGPAGGHFSLWQDGLFGPNVYMTTSNGIDGTDLYAMTPGGHAHFNYGFTEPGIYDVTFQWNGMHTSDGLISASETFTFGVTAVPEPGEIGLAMALGLAGFLGVRQWRRRAGQN